MSKIIQINSLKKYYGDVKAVDDISFSVEEGSLFAFLGVNGAGKSTTINILCTLLEKDSGIVTVCGHDIDKDADNIKKKIGIVFQNSVMDDRLTVADNLRFRASYYGIRGAMWKQRLRELTEMFDLESILKRRYAKLSGGQKRRVDIARGLINKPKVLFLDEPTTGLDPMTRQSIWKIIRQLQSDTGMTVFLTTHYMEESNNADRVVIINKGVIIDDDTPANLKVKYSGDYIKWYVQDSKEITDMLTLENWSFSYSNGCYVIKVNNSNESKQFIIDHKNEIDEFEVVKGNMDDVFLNATGVVLGV